MPYDIRISEDGNYIIGTINAELTRETAQQLAKEYAAIIKSTGIKRILNNVRGVRNEMRPGSTYDYAYNDVQAIGLPQDIRAAILVDEDDRSHHFQETVANNAGYCVAIFQSYEKAVAWLLEGL